MFWGVPRVGDWVRTTQRLPVGLLDQLAGSGLPAGTRGVVVDVAGGFFSTYLMVEYDAGFGGSVVVRTPARHVRVVRRSAGVEAFRRRTSGLAAARAGVAAVFLAPILWFVATYVAQHHSTDGLVSALVLGSVHGFFDFLGYLVEAPLRAAIYLVASTAAWRFAFRS